MAKLSWFRVYTDIPDNFKLRRLEADEQLFFFWYLALYKRGDASTKPEDLSFHLRILQEDAARLMRTMLEARLVLADGTPKGWDEWQFVSDDVTLRTRKHREKTGGAEGETFPKRSRNVPGTPPDTEYRVQRTESESGSVTNPPAPPSSSLVEAIAADTAQAANSEPPVTRAEADALAAQSGVAPAVVEKWWLFQQEQGWVNARGHRMSRDGAFASLIRWKISEHRFAQQDELTAKRIEAAEAIASKDGRNQASTSNLARSGSEVVDRKVSAFRSFVGGIGKGSVYVEKAIRYDSAGLSKADAERLRAGYLDVMGGHPGCVEEDEA